MPECSRTAVFGCDGGGAARRGFARRRSSAGPPASGPIVGEPGELPTAARYALGCLRRSPEGGDDRRDLAPALDGVNRRDAAGMRRRRVPQTASGVLDVRPARRRSNASALRGVGHSDIGRHQSAGHRATNTSACTHTEHRATIGRRVMANLRCFFDTDSIEVPQVPVVPALQRVLRARGSTPQRSLYLPEDLVHHLRRELAGMRVLAARVIAADQRVAVAQRVCDAVTELRLRLHHDRRDVSADSGTRRSRFFRARRQRGRSASALSSASKCGRQFAISSGVGLLSGGAHRTAARMNASRSCSPSSGR